jgi:hypothetical protein
LLQYQLEIVLDQNRIVGNIVNTQSTYNLYGKQLNTGDLYLSNGGQIDATAGSTVVFEGDDSQSQKALLCIP